MPMMEGERRERVYEWRITRELSRHASHSSNYTVRYWIEQSPAWGGLFNMADVNKAILQAESNLSWGDFNTALTLARVLLDAIPAANSVEVCDKQGNGVAAHRDWP